MGDTIWVDVEGRAEDDLPSDSSIMLRLEKYLDILAAKLGVARLTTFYDYSALDDEFGDLVEDEGGDGDGGAPSDNPESPGAWFDSAEAIAAVRAIASTWLGSLTTLCSSQTRRWRTGRRTSWRS